MQFDESSLTPLYQQIADQFTDGILSGAFPEESQIPSTTVVSRTYQLNPATVLKGMNELVAAGLIEKRRGIGMFVKTGAQAKIQGRRKADFYQNQVAGLIRSAKQLGISEAELAAAISKEFKS